MAADELTERLRATAGVTVIDSTARMFLLEAKKPVLDRAMRDFSGWQLVPETRTPLPDTRAKLRR